MSRVNKRSTIIIYLGCITRDASWINMLRFLVIDCLAIRVSMDEEDWHAPPMLELRHESSQDDFIHACCHFTPSDCKCMSFSYLSVRIK
jgi:hypothetical protein